MILELQATRFQKMSSSSSSTLPLSTPPLPQLPVELIGQIIESSVPSQYHSLTFPQRQTTLRNLCLTCRLFRQLAQPLLEQFDHLHLSESGIDSSRRQEDLKLTRVLSVTVLSKRPLGSIESLVLEHPNLEELHIYSRWKDYRFIDVSRLSSLTCERHPTFLLDLELTRSKWTSFDEFDNLLDRRETPYPR